MGIAYFESSTHVVASEIIDNNVWRHESKGRLHNVNGEKVE
jgi:hypothetical protein